MCTMFTVARHKEIFILLGLKHPTEYRSFGFAGLEGKMYFIRM